MSTAPVHPAATVLVLREGTDGVEVFMVKRNRRVGFLPSAWVFPGGRVDPGDDTGAHPHLTGGHAAIARMGVDPAAGRAWLVAAVRETYEEAGIWLGATAPPDAARAALLAGDVDMRQLLDEGATVDLDAVQPWSRWVTPEQERRRYDTWFLAARATAAHAHAVHDAGETVDSAWLGAADAVRRSADGGLMMAPPTWWTLRELAAAGTARGALQAAAARPLDPIQPILQSEDGALRLVLPGHADHPAPAIAGLPDEIRFHQGHWWATPDH